MEDDQDKMGRITKNDGAKRMPAKTPSGIKKKFSREELIERQKKAKEHANALSKMRQSPRPSMLQRQAMPRGSVVLKGSSFAAPKPPPSRTANPSLMPSGSSSTDGFKFVSFPSSLAAIKKCEQELPKTGRFSIAKKRMQDRPRPSLHPLGINVFDKSTTEEDKQKVYEFMKNRIKTPLDARVRFVTVEPIAETKEPSPDLEFIQIPRPSSPAPEVKPPVSILKKKLSALPSCVPSDKVGTHEQFREAPSSSLSRINKPASSMILSEIRAPGSITRKKTLFRSPIQQPVFSTDSDSSADTSAAPDPYSHDQLVKMSDDNLEGLAQVIENILRNRRAALQPKDTDSDSLKSLHITPKIQQERRKSKRLTGRRKSARKSGSAVRNDAEQTGPRENELQESSVDMKDDAKENATVSSVISRSTTKEERRAEFRLQQERLLMDMQKRSATMNTSSVTRFRRLQFDSSADSDAL